MNFFLVTFVFICEWLDFRLDSSIVLDLIHLLCMFLLNFMTKNMLNLNSDFNLLLKIQLDDPIFACYLLALKVAIDVKRLSYYSLMSSFSKNHYLMNGEEKMSALLMDYLDNKKEEDFRLCDEECRKIKEDLMRKLS